MDNFLAQLAARAATKSAELHAAAEARHTGHWYVPENLGLRIEANAVGEFGKMLSKLIGVQDAVAPEEQATAEPAKLPFTIVPGAGVSGSEPPAAA